MSGRSRGARDVLDEIRRVIRHLEQKDSVLNEELKTWKSMSGGSDTEKIQGLVEENANLKEQVKQISDHSGKKMQEMSRLRDENDHLQRSISAKDAEIDKLVKDLSYEQRKLNLLEKSHKELDEKLKKCEADLIGTRAQMNSYVNAEQLIIQEKNDLKQENEALKKTIHRLETTAASTDQTQLEKDYRDLVKEFNKVEAESKRNKENSDHNYTVADQYKTLYEEIQQEKKILQGEIAKLRSGGAAAPDSQSLQSPGQPHAPIAARVNVDGAEDATKDSMTGKKANTSQTINGSKEPAQEGRGFLGGLVDIGKKMVGLGDGGGVTVKKDTMGDGGAADSGSDDSSDDEDNTAAGSAAAGNARPGGLSPEYTVTTEVEKNGIGDTSAATGSKTQVGGGGGAAGGEGRGAAAITADGGAGGGGGGQTQVLADDEDVIKMKATELSIFITSRGWIASENNYTSKYKCFLENESSDNLMKYKLKYNLLGNDRESIINNLNKIAFECNVMTTLGAPDYREMKAKYTLLPELENKKTPPKDQIAEGLSKMDCKKRSQLTLDICLKKLTTIPAFKNEAEKCDIHIDVSRAKGSVKNLYPQVYEVSVS